MKFQGYLRQLGRNIRAARTRRGLKQVDVRDKTGISYRHYQNIEAGKVNVSIQTLCRLSHLFNVSLVELVREVECDSD